MVNTVNLLIISELTKLSCCFFTLFSLFFRHLFYCETLVNDVFKKQNLRPTYNKKRVVELIKAVYPTGNQLLLEARNKEGICIATGIFNGSNKLAIAWGTASYRDFQHLSPNEALRFEAIKYWKAKGFELFEMGGRADYKQKFKPQDHFYVQIVASKFGFLTKGKAVFKKAYYKTRKLISYIRF